MGKYASILNDVIGPVMTGPSSSHTAGCARIGKMARLLYGKEIKKAEIIFDENGSYISTCMGQGSTYGFVGGILSFEPDDIRLKDAIELAKEMGVEVTFSKADIEAEHPNEARINIYNENNDLLMTLLTRSVGGGMIEIVEMDEFQVMIKGDKEILFICANSKSKASINRLLNDVPYETQEKGNRLLYTITNVFTLKKQSIEKIAQLDDVVFIRKADIILPAGAKEVPDPPFSNATEALTYSEKCNKSLWELAINYECSVVNITVEGIFEKMGHVLKAMRKSTEVHHPNDITKTGFLEPQSYLMQEKIKTKRILDAGILNKSMLYAIAVMENNCLHNVVVAAPTAGSCGVIPASVIAVGEEMNLSDEEIIKGLLVSGLLGSFIANQATFGAEVAGCQAENGSASAMAAAGLVQLMEGSVKEGFSAASIALQNLLGLICDPIGGLTEIPCINRNVVAAANAVTSANMSLCGYDAFVPLDETIKTMMDVGEMLPKELKCTCKGGLCNSDTGKKVDMFLAKKRKVL